MSEDNWEPSKEDIEWTEKILETLEPGKSWVEGEMLFYCSEDKTLSLVSRTERAEEPARRVGIVLEKLGWNHITDDVTIIPNDPLVAMEEAQKIATGWMCPHCEDERIINFDLQKVTWESQGKHKALTEDGIEEFTRWCVHSYCPKCKEKVVLTPEDYALIAGEEAFYTWYTDKYVIRAMHREDIIDMVDNKRDIVTDVIGTDWHGIVVPPHMQGTFVSMTPIDEEE